MAPSPDGVNSETAQYAEDVLSKKDELAQLKTNRTKKTGISGYIQDAFTFRTEVVWKNAIGFLIFHIVAIMSAIFWLPKVKGLTLLWTAVTAVSSGLGVTVGTHRLFTHKSYVANTGMKIVLTILFTIAGENCTWVWVRDHRQHHRFSDTDADPHNIKRGFFFAHMGWLMMRKHPAVLEAGKHIDMSDLDQEPLVMFQKRWYKPLYFLFSVCMPVLLPVLCWGESLVASFLVCYCFRAVLVYNVTWSVNSWAHMFGTRPYDKTREARESRFVSTLTLGEGWHNFHHKYPYDYRASEVWAPVDMATSIIEFSQRRGWATGLRKATHVTTARMDATNPRQDDKEE